LLTCSFACFQPKGAKEKDGEARELKFFVRTDSPDDESNAATPPAARGNNGGGRYPNEERVFIHPSSANFSTGAYSCPWLVYHSLVRTSKAFLRDVTECNVYTLLLFGGKLDVVASEGVATVDQWCKLGANARIGSLMAGLRAKVVRAHVATVRTCLLAFTICSPSRSTAFCPYAQDDLLTKKVMDPTFDLAATEEMKLIVQLIATDGLS
jgi:Oligonucleotide/oligosaccharide-binding (OB)-fold